MFSLKATHLLPVAALALALNAPHVARAQPDPNNAPKADNPDNRAPRNNRGQMTPEQREAAIKRYMKNQIERAGVTDEAQQDAVVDYIQDEMDAREALQESSRELGAVLRNPTLTDPQVAGLLNVYLGKVEDDKIRRTAAQKKLKETVDMLKTPRLETMLVLMGAWGDAPNTGGNNWMGRGRGRGRNRN